MAFKMKGFNPGQGTGMGSAFLKKEAAETAAGRTARKEARVSKADKVKEGASWEGKGKKEVPSKEKAETRDTGKSPLTAKPPSWADGVKMKDRKGSGDQKGQVWTKTGVDSEGADEFGYLDKKDARKSERKTRKAEKLRAKAEGLREKKGDKGEKRAARLEKRAASKDIRADVKEKMASNIQQGKDKKADLVDRRGGQTPGMKHRVENPKKHDSEGKHIKGTGKKSSTPEPKTEGTRGDAFKAARAAGKAKFTYKGKEYHTRRADESKEDWQSKFNTTNPSPGPEPKKKIANDKKENKSTKNSSVKTSNVDNNIKHTSGGSVSKTSGGNYVSTWGMK